MIDHIVLTVSNVERSLAFYEATLAPLNIEFFMPYKGDNGHPDLWGFAEGPEHSSGSSMARPIPKPSIGVVFELFSFNATRPRPPGWLLCPRACLPKAEMTNQDPFPPLR